MRRSLFWVLILLNTHLCSAQTKKETEDWLKFYLNKFNGGPINIVNGSAYADSYLFSGHALYQVRYNNLGDSGSWKEIHIDLSRVIKVEIFSDSTVFPMTSRIPCFKIWFYFRPPSNLPEEPPVTMFELYSNKRVKTQWTDPYEIDFGDLEILDNGMPKRLKGLWNI